VYLNGDFRAGDGAKSASCALSTLFLEVRFGERDAGISLLIHPVGGFNEIVGTDRDA
jgi:hypothetical protein